MQNAELTEGRVVLSNEEAMDELAADYAGKLLTDERAIARVMEENRTLGQRIREILRRIGEELRKIFGKSEPTLERAQALWDRAYEQATRNAENGQKNTAREGGARFLVRDGVLEDFKRVRSRTFDSERGEVLIGETSNFLTDEIGAENLLVTMPASKVFTAIATEAEAKGDPRYDPKNHYHGMGEAGLLRVIEKSENPIAAFAAAADDKGKNRTDRIVLVTDEMLEGGLAVAVEVFDKHGVVDGERIRANKVITAYGKTGLTEQLKQAAADGRLLYLDKKRSQTALAGVPGANPLTAIRMSEADFRKNIASFWENVNWEREEKFRQDEREAQNKEGKTAMQIALEEAQKKKTAEGNEPKYALRDEEARKATEWEQAQMDKARDSLTRSCRQAFT